MPKLLFVDRKIIGEIEGRTFTKQVSRSRHMLRIPMAWAIDASVFDSEIKKSCDTIVIVDRDSGKKYQVSVALFDKQKGIVDRGFGRQYFLTLSWWNSEKPVEQGKLI